MSFFVNLFYRIFFTLFLVILVALFIPVVFFTIVTFKSIPPVDVNTFKVVPDDYVELNKILKEKMVEIPNRNVTLCVYEAGDPKNPLILFIHGFPEAALVSWKHQIPFFVKQNYFVLAIDTRYSLKILILEAQENLKFLNF